MTEEVIKITEKIEKIYRNSSKSGIFCKFIETFDTLV